MRTSGTGGLAALDVLLTELDIGRCTGKNNTPPLEASFGEDQQSSQLVFVHFADGFENVPVDGHYATSAAGIAAGAMSATGKSVNIVALESIISQPTGGDILPA